MHSSTALLGLGLGLGLGFASAHNCLLHPDQRGGANVTGPGNHVCYNPGPACGDAARFPVGPPHFLDGGAGFDVMLQQALNHYQPGDEGWIDVSYAATSTPATDAEFTVLARIPDIYKHMQAAQTNYTVPIAVPDVDLKHGVLMVRHHPNKPTEPVAFRNCADIAIVSAVTRRARRAAAAAAVAGPAPLLALVEATQPALDTGGSTQAQQQQLVQVQASGALGVLSTVPSPWRIQGAVVASLPASASHAAQLLFLAAARAPLDAKPSLRAPSTLLRFSEGQSGGWAGQASIDFGNLIMANEVATVQALVTTTSSATPPELNPLRAVAQIARIDPATGAMSYCYMLVDLDASTGKASSPTGAETAPRTTPENTFVNFLWATANTQDGVTSVVMLAGDENSLFKVRWPRWPLPLLPPLPLLLLLLLLLLLMLLLLLLRVVALLQNPLFSSLTATPLSLPAFVPPSPLPSLFHSSTPCYTPSPSTAAASRPPSPPRRSTTARTRCRACTRTRTRARFSRSPQGSLLPRTSPGPRGTSWMSTR
jgi:hypothetical protein